MHRVWVGDEEHLARTVVLAMGAERKRLGVSGEEELSGRGVSYCATCDAAFFKSSPTIIVGGGDSAMEEAIFLSKFASKVVVVHRREQFRASKIMLERARAQPNIDSLTPYRVSEFRAGDAGTLGHAVLLNTDTGEERTLDVAGSFIAVGHEPQSQIVRAQVNVDENGYVITDGRSTRTNVRGCSRGRPGRSHLPPGDHRRRLRLPGGSGRRVVPARHAGGPGAGGDAEGRPGRSAVGAGGQRRRLSILSVVLAAATSQRRAPSRLNSQRLRSGPPP